MASKLLGLLISRAPSWFLAGGEGANQLKGRAFPANSKWLRSSIELVISTWGCDVTVSELLPGKLLPLRCPERHIQSDSTFCLGYISGSLERIEDADVWWEKLAQFLWLQSTADDVGVWPFQHAVDHGGAASFHLRALALAQQLGFENEYEEAWSGVSNWINASGVKFVDAKGKLLNGRQACPRGCFGQRRRFVRKACLKRDAMAELILVERARQKSLSLFWEAERTLGLRCCGRMRDCPAKDW